MYELPVVVDSTIKTECWTYNKTCILETSKFGKNWLATHMNIFLDENYNALFGDGLSIYPLQYFESALKVQSTDIGKIKPNMIVDYIKNSLLQNYYVVMDCNIAKISFFNDKDFYIHQILIYGYDDSEKVFLSPLLNNATGKPEVCKISYDRLQASYADVQEHYIANPHVEFWAAYSAYSWYHSITRLKVRNLSFCKSSLIYNALKKLNNEFEVEHRAYTRYNANKEVSDVINHYVGIGCLLGLESILERTVNGEYDLKSSTTDLTLSLLRLYEHRINLIQTLKLLDSLTRGCISKSGDFINQYIELSEKMKKCYSISKKWYITGKKNLLSDMAEILAYNREREVDVLRHCFDVVYKYLIRRRSNEKKQK